MPLFCTLFWGANDSALPGQRQHVPREEFAKNLAHMIRSIRECSRTTDNHDFPIIIMTPPPVDAETWKRELGLYDYHDRTNDNTREYVKAAKAVAKEMNCPCLDTWELLDGHDIHKYREYLSDGLHLSESGNRKVHEGLMALLESEFPHLAPAKFMDGKYTTAGVQMEEAIWSDLC
jgi:lysophospholipase L1-like esterase